MALRNLRAFIADRTGAVAVTVALASVVLFVVAGVAVDMARAYRAQHALQINVDQAAIAAAAVAYSEVSGSNPNIELMKKVAANYFSTNNALSTDLVAVTEPPQFTYVGQENNLVISVPARLETTFLRIVDINEIRFTVSSQVARPEWGPLELVLALDNTYSMVDNLGGVPKHVTLKAAAKDLVNEVLTNPDVDSNTAIGIVPFATYLRVEPRYWQEDWLRVPSAWSSAGNRCTYPHKRGCRMMPGGSIPCVIDVVSTTCPYDSYETCTDWGQPFCFNDPGQIYSFGGCFSSRPGSLDRIDRLPGPYQGRSPYWDYVWKKTCGQVAMLDLTKSSGRTALLARIDALTPAPNNDTVTDTYTSGGLEFAWQMLTPGLPFDTTMDAADAETIGLTKAVVLITDGVNNSKPYLPACSPNCPGLPTDPLRDNQQLWQVSSCRGNMCAQMEPRKSADDATKSLCTKIKGDGILIFTVALNINDVDARDMLRTCASKPEYFFEAGSRTALLDAFKRIGAQLRNIRIVN